MVFQSTNHENSEKRQVPEERSKFCSLFGQIFALVTGVSTLSCISFI